MYWSNGTMKFENTTFNPHASYNPKTSIFTCDRDGIYVFYVTLMPHKKYRFNQHQYQIIQDHQALTRGFTGRGFNAMFAVVRCSPGSRVWVGGKAVHSHSLQWRSWKSISLNQFGGYQIA